MDDVTEPLPQLIKRRQTQLGEDSLMSLYRRLPDGDDRITYETFRNLANGRQRGARGERVPRDLALILNVPESTVRDAMGLPPTYGEWQLPPQAQVLDPEERGVVMGVVNALIRAKAGAGDSEGGQRDDWQSEAEKNVTETPTDKGTPAEHGDWRRGYDDTRNRPSVTETPADQGKGGSVTSLPTPTEPEHGDWTQGHAFPTNPDGSIDINALPGAARSQDKTLGQHQHEQADKTGEENQDTGGDDGDQA